MLPISISVRHEFTAYKRDKLIRLRKTAHKLMCSAISYNPLPCVVVIAVLEDVVQTRFCNSVLIRFIQILSRSPPINFFVSFIFHLVSPFESLSPFSSQPLPHKYYHLSSIPPFLLPNLNLSLMLLSPSRIPLPVSTIQISLTLAHSTSPPLALP